MQMLVFSAFCTEEFKLVENGKPAASIELPADINMHSSKAFFEARVHEFNQALKQITGTELPLERSPKGKAIRWKLEKPANPMESGSFSITFPDSQTLLATVSGSCYNRVFTHLIETAGNARWLSSENCGFDGPSMKTFSVACKEVFSPVPSFPLGRVAWVLPNVRYQWDMAVSSLYYTHDLPKFVFPPEKYAGGWPEAIMPVLNGKKISAPPMADRPDAYWQPCYSNPETARIAIENILEYIRKRPYISSIGLGINDNGGFCECTACAKLNGKKEQNDKSNVYYMWVNHVAEGVCKVYPNMRFGLLAYRETYFPPDFKLHKNVVPILTIDLFSCINPKVREKHEKNIQNWASKAEAIGVWDYCWGNYYWIPRVAYKLHADMLKFLHKNHCRFYFAENEFITIADGPKMYLVSRLLSDIDTDPDSILDDWFVRCGGKKAAPFLKSYFKRCEDFYRSDPMKKTPWYASSNSVYMTLSDSSWMNALTPEILSGMSKDIEDACKMAETDAQKKRMEEIRLHFRYAEARAKICGAEFLSPDGSVKTPGQARKLLESLCEVGPYLKTEHEISELWKNGEFGKLYKKYTFPTAKMSKEMPFIAAMAKAMPFIRDREVAAALDSIVRKGDLPPLIRSAARCLAETEKTGSLFPNSGFESPVNPSSIQFSGKTVAERSTEYASGGKYSLKITPATLYPVTFYAKVEPGHNYMVMMKVFSPEQNPEAYVDLVVRASANRKHIQWRNLVKNRFPAGVWFDLVAVTNVPDILKVDGVNIVLEFGNFEPRQSVFIDDLVLVRL